jgi:hypothetical protein
MVCMKGGKGFYRNLVFEFVQCKVQCMKPANGSVKNKYREYRMWSSFERVKIMVSISVQEVLCVYHTVDA